MLYRKRKTYRGRRSLVLNVIPLVCEQQQLLSLDQSSLLDGRQWYHFTLLQCRRLSQHLNHVRHFSKQYTIFKENVVQFNGLPVYVSENPSFKQLLGISTIWPDAWGDYYSTWVNVMINNCLHLSKIDNTLLNSSRCPAALDISLANAPNSWCQFILKCCYCSVMILTWWYNSSDTCTCGVFITVLICPSIYCQLLNVYLSPLSYDLQYFSAMYIVSACIASSGGKRLVLLSGHSVTVVLTITAVIGHKLFWVGET